MNEHYENIRSKTVCTECGGTDMGMGYLYESGGAVKKKAKVLGLDSYQGNGNMLLILCRKCGFVAKSFVVAK